MSWLFIDTGERARIRLAIFPETGSIRETRINDRRDLVAVIASFVTDQDLASLTGVCVVAGPGSFSAIRGGVLVANLLARMYHVPLVGIAVDDAHDLEAVRTKLVSGDYRPADYVAPVYDAEPNITVRNLEFGI